MATYTHTVIANIELLDRAIVSLDSFLQFIRDAMSVYELLPSEDTEWIDKHTLLTSDIHGSPLLVREENGKVVAYVGNNVALSIPMLGADVESYIKSMYMMGRDITISLNGIHPIPTSMFYCNGCYSIAYKGKNGISKTLEAEIQFCDDVLYVYHVDRDGTKKSIFVFANK